MCTTKKFFDGYADEWDKVNRYEMPKEAFEDLVSMLNLKRGSKVVDLGCGTGVLTPYLTKVVGPSGVVFSADISEKMLNNLRKRFSAGNIEIVYLNTENISKIDSTVDAVICFSMFPHIENQEAAIKEIASILKPKGRFLIAHFSCRKEINKFHSKLPKPICHHNLPDEKTMTNMLHKYGFDSKRLPKRTRSC